MNIHELSNALTVEGTAIYFLEVPTKLTVSNIKYEVSREFPYDQYNMSDIEQAIGSVVMSASLALEDKFKDHVLTSDNPNKEFYYQTYVKSLARNLRIRVEPQYKVDKGYAIMSDSVEITILFESNVLPEEYKDTRGVFKLWNTDDITNPTFMYVRDSVKFLITEEVRELIGTSYTGLIESELEYKLGDYIKYLKEIDVKPPNEFEFKTGIVSKGSKLKITRINDTDNCLGSEYVVSIANTSVQTAISESSETQVQYTY